MVICINYKCTRRLLLLCCVVALFGEIRLLAGAENIIEKKQIEQMPMHEPKGTVQLTLAISLMFQQLGIDETYMPQDSGDNLATEIAEQFKAKLPENFEECISFLRKLVLPYETKKVIDDASVHAIKQAGVSGISDADLLSFVIEQFLIYQVQNILVYDYQERHPEIDSDEDLQMTAIPFYMCDCAEATVQKRIVLILFCVHDVQQKFKKDARIVVTAQNSGELLMEYLVVRALQHVGYRKFTVNIIDQLYRLAGHQRSSVSGRVAYINEFAMRLALGQPHMYTDVNSAAQGLNVFGSVVDYATLCAKRSEFKATVMLAVDVVMNAILPEYVKPFVGEASVAGKFRPLINCVDISVSLLDGPCDVILYMPRFCKPRLYWDRVLMAEFVQDKVQNAVLLAIAQLADTLEPLRQQDIAAYRQKFVEGVVNQIRGIFAKEYKEDSKEIIQAREQRKQDLSDEDFKVNREKVIRARIKSRQPMLSSEQVEELVAKRLAQALQAREMMKALTPEEFEQMIAARTEQSLREYEKHEAVVALKYKMDPYVLFKELVYETLRSNGVAYSLGANFLQRISKDYLMHEKYYYSPIEFLGAKDIRCILRSPEFVELQL